MSGTNINLDLYKEKAIGRLNRIVNQHEFNLKPKLSITEFSQVKKTFDAIMFVVSDSINNTDRLFKMRDYEKTVKKILSSYVRKIKRLMSTWRQYILAICISIPVIVIGALLVAWIKAGFLLAIIIYGPVVVIVASLFRYAKKSKDRINLEKEFIRAETKYINQVKDIII